MTRLYGRRYRVEIGKEPKKKENSKPDGAESSQEESGGISIETLRIAFQFEKTATPEPNNGKVRIFNLNPSNRQKILSGEYKNIRVSVGYNELRMIFLGEIVKSTLVREGVDWVIDLEVADGQTDYTKAYANMTVAAGSTNAEIYQYIAQTFSEVTLGDMDNFVDTPLPRGKSLFGNSRDVLNQVSKNNQADWSIQDNELVVIAPNKIRDDQAVLLSQTTGMIGSPEGTDNGLKVKCLINPDLKIQGLVRVASINNMYNGDYKIVHMVYSGDTHSEEWSNEITVVGGNFIPIDKKKKNDKKDKKKEDLKK